VGAERSGEGEAPRVCLEHIASDSAEDILWSFGI
jgi:hypothetical protein